MHAVSFSIFDNSGKAITLLAAAVIVMALTATPVAASVVSLDCKSGAGEGFVAAVQKVQEMQQIGV